MKTYARILVLACILIGLGLSTRSVAQNQESDTWPDSDSFEPLSAADKYAGITIASITVSPETNGVPCFNCVPNAGGNIGLPLPRFLVRGGEKDWSTTVVFYSSLPEGGCSVSMSWFHLGSQEVVVGPSTYDFDNCASTWGFVAYTNIVVPNKPGDVKVIATVKSESGVVEASSGEFIKIIE